ncbi:MAG: hypothetical protein AAGK17_11575 [Pseudomonadota bacterium]
MSVYQAAVRHAWWMAVSLVVAILFVLVIDRVWGHSSLAFAAAIIGLVAANARMLSFNCTQCGKNLFFRGVFVVLWPNRVCTKCGAIFDQE